MNSLYLGASIPGAYLGVLILLNEKLPFNIITGAVA